MSLFLHKQLPAHEHSDIIYYKRNYWQLYINGFTRPCVNLSINPIIVSTLLILPQLIKDLTASALHESLGLSVYHCIKYSFQVVFVLSVKIVALD